MSQNQNNPLTLAEWAEKAYAWINTLDQSYSQVEDKLKAQGLTQKEINQVIQMVKERRQNKAKGNRKTTLILGIGLIVLGLGSPFLTLALGLSQEVAVGIAGSMGAMGILTLIGRGRG